MTGDFVLIVLNIVIAIASVIYAVVSVITYRLMKEAEKERLRRAVLDALKLSIVPLHEEVKRALSSLKEEFHVRFSRNPRVSLPEEFSISDGHFKDKTVLSVKDKAINKVMPRIKSYVAEYNEKLSELEEAISKVNQKLMHEGFYGLCDRVLDESGLSDKGLSAEDLAEAAVLSTITGLKNLNSVSTAARNFWETRCGDLLSEVLKRAGPEIEAIKQKRDECMKLAEHIDKELVNLLKALREKYSFSLDEMSIKQSS